MVVSGAAQQSSALPRSSSLINGAQRRSNGEQRRSTAAMMGSAVQMHVRSRECSECAQQDYIYPSAITISKMENSVFWHLFDARVKPTHIQ